MARRRRAEKRIIPPDIRYGSVELSKFINKIMWNGKKTVAQRIVYKALDIVEQQTNRSPLEVFEQAIRNATPMLEVRSRRVGGATYQVPIEVTSRRKTALAIRWILTAARARNEKSMQEKLAAELSAAANGDGAAVKKKSDTHRMAEANKAFAHFRF